MGLSAMSLISSYYESKKRFGQNQPTPSHNYDELGFPHLFDGYLIVVIGTAVECQSSCFLDTVILMCC